MKRLILKLKGDAYGAVALAGPEDWVEARLHIGTTTYCGRFEVGTSEVKKNDPGKVILKGPSIPCIPPTPTATPTDTPTDTPTVTPTNTPEFTCFGLPFEDANVCSGNGTCVAQDDCECFLGWTGIMCEEADEGPL